MFKEENLKKISFLLFIFFSLFTLLGIFSNSNAAVVINCSDPANPTCPGSNASAICSNPFSTYYTTQDCVEQRLGLSSIQSDTIFIARDPNSIIVVAFRIFLYIVITIIVARIVFVGMKIAGAGDDADKRKEHFIELVNIIVGLVVAIGGLGITFVVEKTVFADTFNDQIIKCSDLPTNASQTLKDKCKNNVTTISPTTTTSTTKTCVGDLNSSLRINVSATSPCPTGMH